MFISRVIFEIGSPFKYLLTTVAFISSVCLFIFYSLKNSRQEYNIFAAILEGAIGEKDLKHLTKAGIILLSSML